MRAAHPLLIGLRAARANFWPGLCLQLVMLLIVAAYYRADWARPLFDRLASFKAKGGVFFSIGAAMIAGAVLPEILGVLFFQKGRATRRNLDNLLFALVFWAINGVTVDLFYRGQGFWFGTQPTVSILVKKLLVDQFIYTGLFAAPFAVWGYEWKNRRYRTARIGELFTAGFYVEKILPTMIANWGVWFPACTLIYCLPPLLQVPLFSLALTFWALILAYINSTERRPEDSIVAAVEKM